MVEGPGCKLKGEKMKGTVVGQRLVKLAGAAVDDISNKKAVQKIRSGLHNLTGQRVVDVKTLGKELFIFFHSSESCLRVHFLMSGYVRYNNKQGDPDEGATRGRGGDGVQGTAPRLELQLDRDSVQFYLCSVELRPAPETRQRWDAMVGLDFTVP